MEFFENIWAFVTKYKETILTILSYVVLFITTIRQLVISTKNNKLNSLLSPTVDANTAALNNAVDVINNLEKENNELKAQVAKTQENSTKSIAELQGCVDSILLKINTMLDVQGLVYQTAKDPKTRETIANLITNAKYSETATRAKIVEELEALKKKSEEAAAATKAEIEDTVTKAKALLEPTEKKEEPVVVPRG